MKIRRVVVTAVLGILLLCTGVQAWPTGFVYSMWPYLYFQTWSGWHYVDPGGQQWCSDFSQWSRFGHDVLANGWLYFQWPHAFNFPQGPWYYFDEQNPVWCFDYQGGFWYAMSRPTDTDQVYEGINRAVRGQAGVFVLDYIQANVAVGMPLWDNSTGYLKTIRDVDVADRYGNWLLGDGTHTGTQGVYSFYDMAGHRVMQVFLGL